LLNPDGKSDYMWSDGEDFVVIADIYQVNIKTITMKSSTDPNPSVTWIYPDKDMKKFAELKDVDQNDMVLLHEDESHFNLIVSKDSDLAKYGSLSFRFNVGPTLSDGKGGKDILENEEYKKDVNEDVIDELKKDDQVDLRKELKKCKEERKKTTNGISCMSKRIESKN
jgi:hypothetical protein